MASRHLSVRLESESFDRLDAESRRSGQTRSQLAKMLLDEGLRMEAHPGIVFRGGPAGRRAGVAGGPDVWEVVRVLRRVREQNEDLIEQTAALTGISAPQVTVAAGYYAEFRDEVDRWITRVDAEAGAAEAAWRRRQDILGE
ncbi:MAG: hypothetical protein GEU80_06795 [Dehalococcoidia bacterium]|nr:hypothetical protein [Dehalococcoidia bacterium]